MSNHLSRPFPGNLEGPVICICSQPVSRSKEDNVSTAPAPPEQVKTKTARVWSWLIEPVVLATAAIVLASMAFVLCTLALNAGSEDKTSDWISAFGTAFGAALTGGALLIAALTYSRQVADKHRQQAEQHQAQAAAVLLILHKGTMLDGKSAAIVTNRSTLPVYKMELFCRDPEGRVLEDGRPYVSPVFVNEFPAYFDEGVPLYDAYVDFTDQATNRWRRWSDGRLEELHKAPADV